MYSPFLVKTIICKAMLIGILDKNEVVLRFEAQGSHFSEYGVELLYDYYAKQDKDVMLDIPSIEADWKEFASAKDAVDILASNPDEVYGWITDEVADEEGMLKDDLIYEKCKEWLEIQDDFVALVCEDSVMVLE